MKIQIPASASAEDVENLEAYLREKRLRATPVAVPRPGVLDIPSLPSEKLGDIQRVVPGARRFRG